MLGVYRNLLRLYPAIHRERFSEEMIAVFSDMEAETAQNGLVARIVFYVRETAGVIAGSMQEHFRAFAGDDGDSATERRRAAGVFAYGRRSPRPSLTGVPIPTR